MPEYKVECYGCAEEHTGSAFDIDQYVKQCEWCHDDICDKCRSKLNPLRCENCENEE